MSLVTQALLAYADSDNTNPTDPTTGLCLYTDIMDSNRHCIAGQVWCDLGGDVSLLHENIGIWSHLAEGSNHKVAAPIKFSVDEINIMADAQSMADGYAYDLPCGDGVPEYKVNGERAPRPWKHVVQGLKDMELL